LTSVPFIGGPRPFHRADVQDVLLSAISSSIRTHLSHRLISYMETPNGTVLEFQNGTTAQCDMVVGADGINSAVRKCLVDSGRISNPNFAEPRWSGSNVYRGLIASDAIRRVSPDHRALYKPMVVSDNSQSKSKIREFTQRRNIVLRKKQGRSC
jgi:salicylate hydroxylase